VGPHDARPEQNININQLVFDCRDENLHTLNLPDKGDGIRRKIIVMRECIFLEPRWMHGQVRNVILFPDGRTTLGPDQAPKNP
jgi:hypothetical protein